MTDNVVFVDLASGKTVARKSAKPGVYGIDTFGKCAVVVSEEAKALTFMKLSGGNVSIEGSWDLRNAGDMLKRPRSLAANSVDDHIFVRSSYVCPSCTTTQSSVWSFNDDGSMMDKCR